jgi:hypothetical protein
MSCETVRDLLLRGAAEDLVCIGHLEACVRCAEFARRLAEVREALRLPGSPAEPDSAFAARVVARLPASRDMLGWAALRALPAALALAAALTWIGFQELPSADQVLTAEPTADGLLSPDALAPELFR